MLSCDTECKIQDVVKMNQIVHHKVKNNKEISFVFFHEYEEHDKYSIEGESNACFIRNQQKMLMCRRRLRQSVEDVEHFHEFPKNNNCRYRICKGLWHAENAIKNLYGPLVKPLTMQ